MSTGTVHLDPAARKATTTLRAAQTSGAAGLGVAGGNIAVTVHSADPWRRRGVAHLLDAEPGIVIVPGTRAVEADVVVVVGMDARTLDVLPRVARFVKGVVLIADDLGGLDVPTAAQCRVVSVLSAASAGRDDLVHAVRAAPACALSAGELAKRLAAEFDAIDRPARSLPLAARERELLRLLAEGCDTAEIAAKLCYSERTVKNIVHGLLDRLNLRNRAHAVAYALRTGVL